MKIIPVLVSFVLVITATRSHRMHPLSDEFIDFINSNQTLWRAGRNFHRHTPLKYLKRLAGTIKVNATFDDGLEDEPPVHKYKLKNIPFQFDARQKWRNCPTIRDIRDQGSCGSCWAVSAVSAMSDRICIRTQGRKKVYFSEFDIMSCCMTCGGSCETGGVLEKAWQYAVKDGVVSGGKYNSHEGCKPYTIPPCDHNIHHHGNKTPCGHYIPQIVCECKCQKGYKTRYRRDKIRMATYYKLTDEKKIMTEIYENGPMTASFELHEDFFSYKSGVYRHVAGKVEGYHSVKLIGWGEERGVTYWLAANSWNTDWGDNGFFKIIRGVNHLGIEDKMYAGLFRRESKSSLIHLISN
ncbi:hypothetical protein ABMA27_002731 [Loxostege sticticalis]|uniref:Peptidase C1A papain C-terminal domain-containing protein n=1 Tax=Loxostege sticticalis TaxID=481309 RepID=A0ABR3HUN4_LOXSC